jgi:NADP-dependent 3-hydroxy acid dehydrogenase YdfG
MVYSVSMCQKCEEKHKIIKTAWNGGLPKAIVVVTGVKLNKAQQFFKAGIPATLIDHDGAPHKMNSAAGTAVVLNKDFLVYAVGYDHEQLKALGDQMMPKPHFARQFDLLNKEEVQKMVAEIKKIKEATGLAVHLAHYGGASDTKSELPHNSVFSHTWDIPGDSLPDLVANNCTTLLNVVQEMHRQEIFEDQEISKIILISAITALRTKMWHGNDATQKGAGHSLIRSMALDLTPEKIYVTEVMPGMTDTGFYDNPWTLDVLFKSASALGYDYTPETVPMFTAEVVGEAVEYVLKARGNVRELSVMPFGQYPHLGA